MNWMDWYGVAAVSVSTTVVALPIGFFWATRIWYPQIRKLNRELSSERRVRIEAESKLSLS